MNIAFLYQKTIGAIMKRIRMIEPRIYISISFHSIKNIYRCDEHKEFTFHLSCIWKKSVCLRTCLFT